MKNDRKAKNREGQIILQRIKLKYTKAIIEMLEANPKTLEILLERLEKSKEDFFNELMNYKETNIILYDQAYTEIKQLLKKENQDNRQK